MIEFLSMGGYAPWVWGAFGLTIVVLVANLLAADQRYQRSVRRLQARLARSRSTES